MPFNPLNTGYVPLPKNKDKTGEEFFSRLFPKSPNDPDGILQKISKDIQQDTLENIVPYLKLVK